MRSKAICRGIDTVYGRVGLHFHAVSALGLSVLLVGMVLTPAAIEVEEVVRQAVPAREGLPEVSAGNLVGTLLYFLWFNVGLISLLVPVRVNPQVIAFDWPFLVAVTWMATFFFARGRTTRWRGAPFRLHPLRCPPRLLLVEPFAKGLNFCKPRTQQ
jgi:Ca2+/Na+ antiporter